MLDKFGFRRKNFAELKEEIETQAKEVYGQDINLSLKSPFGFIFWLFAWFLSKAWELAEKVYNSNDITKAEGVQLDRLTPMYNTSRNPERFAEVPLSFTGTANHTIFEGTRFETESGIEFSLTEDVTLDVNGFGSGQAVALTAGTVGNVATGSITVQSEPSADVETVSNTEAATGGRTAETDAELVNRLLNSGGATGSGTINAILAAVRSVPGVRAANISVNNESVAVNGQDAHSNQVFALGGDGQAIAEAIFSNYTGIQAYGTTTFTVADVSGNNHTIGYTPATAVPIFATVTVTTDSTFEVTGANQIKDAVIKIIGGTASDGTIYTGLNMGDDVIYSKIIQTVMSIQGVTDASITIGKTAGSQGASNIAISPNEVAQATADNVSVVVS